MSNLYVCDTNILLDYIEKLHDYKVVLLSHTLRELEKHKSSHKEELKMRAREVSRYINDNRGLFHIDAHNYDGRSLGDQFTNTYEDDNILAACVRNKYYLITDDVLLKFKAEGLGLNVTNYTDFTPSTDYKGYMEVFINKGELDNLFDDMGADNPFNLLVNQYLIVKDARTQNEELEDQVVLDVYKYDGNFYNRVSAKGFNTIRFGHFKPRDIYQELVLDSLEENKMTMVKGEAGSGKSMIALNYAFKKIEKGKRDKLICFVNPVASKGSAKLGFYPGTRDEKLLDSSVGSMLAAKFGDKGEVGDLIQSGVLTLLPFADIRGFDTTGMNAIIHILEAQNLDKSLIKLAIERIGDDCELIIDGDYNAQVDSAIYEGANNGMRRVSEIFKGQSYYGEVELPIVHRSELAKRAALI